MTNLNKNEVNWLAKIVYALTAGPSQMYLSVLNIYSTIYLLEVAKLPPSKASMILFISRVFDAITDPIYGYLIDNTKAIKFGRFKLWILISFPLTAVSYLMLWYAPPSVSSENGKLIWYLVWNCLFFTFITGVRLPLVSLNRNLTKSNKERELMTTLRMASEIVGILAGIGIQTPFTSIENQCKRANLSSFSIEISQFENQTNSSILIEARNNFFNDNKYLSAALVLTVLFVLAHVALILFVKEKYEEEEQMENGEQVGSGFKGILKELKQMLTFKPFVILSISSFLNTFGVQVIQTQLQLYFEFGYTAVRELFTYAVLGLLGCSILLVPVWQILMQKLGKKLCIMVGCSTVLPLTIGFMFFKTNAIGEIVTLFSLAAFGASCFTVTILVPWAMLPECIDYYYLKFGSKSDALFGSFFIIGPKILMAIYLGVSQSILSAVGYQNGICAEDQSKYVSLTVIYLISFVPSLSFLVSIVSIYFYPIDEKQARQISESIRKIANEKKDKNQDELNLNEVDFEFDGVVRF